MRVHHRIALGLSLLILGTPVWGHPNTSPAYHLDRADRLAQARQWAAALAEYNQVLARRPSEGDAHAGRARVFLAQDQENAALGELAEALRVERRCAEALVLRAELRMKKKEKLDQALADLNAAVLANRKHPRALFVRGKLHFERGEDWGQAIQDLSAHLKNVNDRDAAALALRGLAYLNLNDHGSALDDFNKALALDPNHGEAYLGRGQVYEHQGQATFEKALADYGRAIALLPKDPRAYWQRGHLNAEILHKYQAAVADLTKYLELCGSGEKTEALLLRGKAFAKLRELAKARKDFDTLLAEQPSHLEALLEKANLCDQEEKPAEAAKIYTQVIEQEPVGRTAYLAYALRATMNNRLEKVEEALADVAQAIRIVPNYGFGHRVRGAILVQRGRAAEALADYNRALDLESGQYKAYALLGRATANRHLGKLDEALADLNKAVETYPTNNGLYTQRASLYLALGKFAEARNDYERVQKQEAAEADADLVRQAYVGILVEALSGDYDKAAAKAEAVVKEHAGDLHWLYDVACAYAIAAEVAGKDPKLADRAGRAKQLGDRALEVLADTIKAGYTNFIHVRTDPDFLVLHNDPRFRQLARFPDAKGK